MKREDIDFLEKYGWVVECESPFEISANYDPESRATGEAAEIVLEHLKRWDKKVNSGY